MRARLTNYFFISFLFILTGFTAFSCANSTNSSFSSDTLHKESDNYLSFYDNENGRNNHWEINYEEEKIVSIYRNGEMIPREDYEEYRHMINEKLDEVRFGYNEYNFKNSHFGLNFEEFHDELKKLNKKIHSHVKIDVDFNEEKFEKSMECLKEKLEKLKEHPFNIDLELDFDELGENVDAKLLKLDDLDINFEELGRQMKKLNEELQEMDIDLDKLDEELESLNKFIDKLKEELAADGYIDINDENVEIKVSATEILVNGVKLPEEKLKKYKNLYKKYMGENLSQDSNIYIH